MNMSDSPTNTYGPPLSDLERHLMGFELATAEILYHMPDYPAFLQSFVWQELDMAPDFPILRRFLDFWHQNLDGRLHSVRVASKVLVRPQEFRVLDGEFHLH